MSYWRCIGLLTVVLLSIFVLPVGASPTGTTIHFSSLDKSQPFNLSGTLYLPENSAAPCPAVVIVHGTAGVDMRDEFYRGPLLNAGIATFEVDFKTGVFASAMNRPQIENFLPMAFAALKELRKSPAIDPARIAIMGFSMGGGVTLRTAMESHRKDWMGDEKGFAAQAAFYPVCKPFEKKLEESGSRLTGTPMIIFYGTEDVYGDGKAAPELKKTLAKKYNFEVTTVEYAGATHGFNRNAPSVSYPDPAAKDGRGYMAWDEKAANDSVTRVVAFLRESLGAK